MHYVHNGLEEGARGARATKFEGFEEAFLRRRTGGRRRRELPLVGGSLRAGPGGGAAVFRVTWFHGDHPSSRVQDRPSGVSVGDWRRRCKGEVARFISCQLSDASCRRRVRGEAGSRRIMSTPRSRPVKGGGNANPAHHSARPDDGGCPGIESVAEGLTDEALGETFLASPHVQVIREAAAAG